MLKNCQTPEQFLRQWRDKLHSGCRQRNKEDWQEYCLKEFRGKDGCKQCTIAYLNEEYKE